MTFKSVRETPREFEKEKNPANSRCGLSRKMFRTMQQHRPVHWKRKKKQVVVLLFHSIGLKEIVLLAQTRKPQTKRPHCSESNAGDRWETLGWSLHSIVWFLFILICSPPCYRGLHKVCNVHSILRNKRNINVREGERSASIEKIKKDFDVDLLEKKMLWRQTAAGSCSINEKRNK